MIRRSFLLVLLPALVLFAAVACQQGASSDKGTGDQQAAVATSTRRATATASPAPAETSDNAAAVPPPPPLVLNGSQPQGTASITGELTYDRDFLLRIDARRTSAPDEPGAGIARVDFRISSSTVAGLYTFVDYEPPYCVFGGGVPTCNPWPFVDGAYRWGENGPPIEPDSYYGQATFHYTPESDDGSGINEDFWTFTFEISRP